MAPASITKTCLKASGLMFDDGVTIVLSGQILTANNPNVPKQFYIYPLREPEIWYLREIRRIT